MEGILQPIMSAFGMLGGNTPARRFAGVFAVGSGAEYMLKPGYAYENGQMRPNAYLSPDAPNATYVPAFLIPAALGIISATFI